MRIAAIALTLLLAACGGPVQQVVTAVAIDIPEPDPKLMELPRNPNCNRVKDNLRILDLARERDCYLADDLKHQKQLTALQASVRDMTAAANKLKGAPAPTTK